MSLRIFKAVVASILWWCAVLWSIRRLPDIVTEHWRTDRKHWATFETLSAWPQTVCIVLVITSTWEYGERQVNGERSFQLQQTKLLKYSGMSLLLVLLISELTPKSRLEGNEQKMNLALVVAVLLVIASAMRGFLARSDKKTVYGLQHGRLHLDARVPMWMNMGYWKASESAPFRPKSLAEACRDLLNLVLAEAGFSGEALSDRSRCLIDVGFGCGEQIIHLMSEKPIRPYDKLWWDDEHHRVYFDHYIGVTQDKAQHQYAQKRIKEMNKSQVNVFCADASKPRLWDEDLDRASRAAQNVTQETWLLALDTAYHFSPSRWGLFQHMWRDYAASIMAFDLCLSPSATTSQRIILRVVTRLMGAPWANFDTPEAYRQKLNDLGYPSDKIKIVDITDNVFAPLAEFMDNQDLRLQSLGLGLGSFKAAKWLFGWWGKTGVVRAVVVIAKFPMD